MLLNEAFSGVLVVREEVVAFKMFLCWGNTSAGLSMRNLYQCPWGLFSLSSSLLPEKSTNVFHWNHLSMCVFLFHGETAPSGPGPPHYRGFTVTFRHTTLGSTPLDEWSNHHRYLYPTTHNSHKRQITTPLAGF